MCKRLRHRLIFRQNQGLCERKIFDESCWRMIRMYMISIASGSITFGFNDIRNIVHLYNTGEQYNEDFGAVNLNGVDYIITQKNDTIRCRIK